MYNCSVKLTSLASIFRYGQLQMGEQSVRLTELEDALAAERKKREEDGVVIGKLRQDLEEGAKTSEARRKQLEERDAEIQELKKELKKTQQAGEEKTKQIQSALDEANRKLEELGANGEKAIEAYKLSKEFDALVDSKSEGFYQFGYNRAIELMKKHDPSFDQQVLDAQMSP